jgi:hypothetical protein
MNPIKSLRFRDTIKQQFGRDLVFHAPLDEQAGQQNTRDLSGNLLQGQYQGNVALNAEAILSGLDSSVTFDGVSSFVELQTNFNEKTKFFFSTFDFTLICFLKIKTNKRQSIIGNRPVGSQAGRWQLDVLDTRGLRVSVSTTAKNFELSSPTDFMRVGAPSMVLLAGDGENISFGRDTEKVTIPLPPDVLIDNVSLVPFAIGKRPIVNDRFFDGDFSDFLFFNRALTDQEIDFVYREAIRGMSLWDWFSQAYPESDLFLEFDEPSGTTLVNQANGNGQYFGNIELQQARISSRTGLSAKFDGSSAYAEIPEQCNCIQRTAVFSMGVIIKRDEESTSDHWIYSTGVEDEETGFDWLVNQSGSVTFRVRGNSVTTSQVFDAGVSFDTGQHYFIAMTGNGSNLFLYVNGVLKDTKPATTVAENATRDLLIGLNKPSGSVFSPFTFGVAFITTTTMQAHEVAHIHKLTELGGYFDRAKEFLEYEITTGETSLPEPPPPPPPGDGGYLLTEDGFILTTEAGDRLLFEDIE